MTNPRVRIKNEIPLSNKKYLLKTIEFDYHKKDGSWEEQCREVYDRGDGAAAFLYDPQRKKVILTNQFRMPPYLNGNSDGRMSEICAGVVEKGEEPSECMLREIEEETGFRVEKVNKVFELYMSPASVTEKIFFFLAEYSPKMKKTKGGGVESEHEEIEVVEKDFSQIRQDLKENKITDAKTLIMFQYAQMNGLLD